MRKFVLVALFFVTFSLSAFGQQERKGGMEWGLRAGANLPKYSTPDGRISVENQIGWHAGMEIKYNFGAFAIGPEVVYMRHALVIHNNLERDSKRIKMHSVDIPLLFSLRAWHPMRIDMGPVFTVMNNCQYTEGDQRMQFGPLRPTVSFTIGVGVEIGRHFFADLRYNGQFRPKECFYPMATEYRFKMKSHSFSLSIGAKF